MTLQLAEKDRVNAQRLALHEMGHYVAARALGFRTGDVWIKVTPDGGNGISATLPKFISSLGDMKSYIEGRILVLFSGVLSEAFMFNPNEPIIDRQKAMNIIEYYRNFGNSDQNKIDELILTYFNMTNLSADTVDVEPFQGEANDLFLDFFHRATDLIEENADVIRSFAVALADQVISVPKKVTLRASELEKSPEILGILLRSSDA